MNSSVQKKQPTFFISHGGGPCFWMNWGTPDPFAGLADFLKNFSSLLPQKPSSILVISAHWEESEYTLQTHPSPPMLYDYYGFPEHTYRLQYPGKTSPELIQRVQDLFSKAQVPLNTNPHRGYDHGLFVPFLLMFPQADIPIVQLSIKKNLDPADHIRMGKILEPLRDENVLIVGSGLSYHNLRQLMDVQNNSQPFNEWLNETNLQPAELRNAQLQNWLSAPKARQCHPREDHLVPLFVVSGAASTDVGHRVYNEQMSNWKFWTSSFQFG